MSRLTRLQIWKNISTSAVSVAKKTFKSELKKPMPKNPGVNLRLRAISQAENGLPMDLEDDIDDLELDAMKAHEAFDDHERELRMQKHVQAMKIVERKYFKMAKEPNMVFWEEKEQIRYLHNSDPEEWDVARLAQSFPVSQPGVKKILKANWNPQDRERIQRYNESVRRNWKLLEDGKLDVDEKLKVHIMKFMSREKAQLPPSVLPLPVNTGTSPSKDLRKGGAKIADTARVNLEKQRKETQQQQKSMKSELPGTYKMGDYHFDSDDGEFLFRVPGMKS